MDFFRQLLAMTPEERETSLTNRPPEIRERILAKVSEYEALDPDERELRLRATELRWYLLPLLRESPSEPRRAAGADPGRTCANWSNPGSTNGTFCRRSCSRNFWKMNSALRYFAHLDVSNNPTLQKIAPPGSELARWNAMSETQRKQIAASVNQFFELTPDEKEATLNTLSDAERGQMEKTLQAFDKLPRNQRDRMHSRLREVRRHECGRKAGIFEKRRTLVANVAGRTAGLARPRRECAAMAAAAARDSSRQPPPPLPRTFIRRWPPIRTEPARISIFHFRRHALIFPPCIRLRFNSAR